MQVLNETETLVPAKMPVAPLGGSTLTTDRFVAGGSWHGPPPLTGGVELHAARAAARRAAPARPRGRTLIACSEVGVRGKVRNAAGPASRRGSERGAALVCRRHCGAYPFHSRRDGCWDSRRAHLRLFHLRL